MGVIEYGEFTLLAGGLVEKMQLVGCLVQSPDGTLDVPNDKALTIIKAVEEFGDDKKLRLAETINNRALKQEARKGLHFNPKNGDKALQLKAEAAAALLILITEQLNLRVSLAD